ncbi:hypothetical protein CDAR_454591 [Caerostris darwini]|uniref:Uncharacterized protein n=1 Tax=Caerostris darwini TaxID=1538125 RepID=A0AAV4TYZ7_9ARAC|nr:hypothetical protein CDAR_454591 [Caerostris darwini]
MNYHCLVMLAKVFDDDTTPSCCIHLPFIHQQPASPTDNPSVQKTRRLHAARSLMMPNYSVQRLVYALPLTSIIYASWSRIHRVRWWPEAYLLLEPIANCWVVGE